MAFLDPVFNPVLLPLVNWNPLIAMILLSFVISLLIVLVYKFFTNQEEMKRLKEEQKEFQKRMRELRENPAEMMKIQKEAMSKNFDYMKHSIKAMLITMLPVILFFGWMNAHLNFEPIFPGETYSVTAEFGPGVNGRAELIPDQGTQVVGNSTQEIAAGKTGTATWSLKSSEGAHDLTIKTGTVQQTKTVLISTGREYLEPTARFSHSDITFITVNHQKLIILPIGFRNWLGWLGVYILLSIVFSIALRKVMKVY